MKERDIDIHEDIERVKSIPIIPNLLDVVCQITGMGFAAVARVTETRWITCSVRDDIEFGLVPGSELTLETTICNEIRDSHQPVVIDHVAKNELFCNHHTPLMYGFQSYVSYPIILKTGEFFGTLCAIDPEPRSLQNPAITGMFSAFADLISFHLQQVELLHLRDDELESVNRQLNNSEDENRQYRHISTHTLQEPLRKLRVFTGMLLGSLDNNQIARAKELALRIQTGAERFSGLISDLTDLSRLSDDKSAFGLVDIGSVSRLVASEFDVELQAKSATVYIGHIPDIFAIPFQIEQLFFHLFDNAIKFSKLNTPLNISISAEHIIPNESDAELLSQKDYIQISFSDNGIGIERSQLDVIFDIFSQLPTEIFHEGSGVGLAICRKIVRNHSGKILIQSETGKGTVVKVVMPIE